MKRTPMKRSTPLRATPATARASVPVFKPRKCRACGELFTRARPMQVVCSKSCSLAYVAMEKAKADRAADRKKKQDQKPIGKLEEECRRIVQKIARIRDRNDGCISCHMGPDYSGIWHGSHYRAHGACSSLQFHLWNIHKACEQCNYFKGGNKEGFIAGLLAKPGYGRERIEWLDAQPKSRRFEREYLIRFKAVMGKRANRLEKRAKEAA